MINRFFIARRSVSLAVVAAALAATATTAGAVRVENRPPPAASAVRDSVPEPANVQADESGSLRQGTIGAVDERASRVQVQGVWLDVLAGKTQLLRNGQPAGLETLKAGEAIRFTVFPGAGAAPAMKVIYAP
jgi:hypothetical protein